MNFHIKLVLVHLSLMFTGKPGSYPSEAPERGCTLGKLRPFPKTLD